MKHRRIIIRLPNNYSDEHVIELAYEIQEQMKAHHAKHKPAVSLETVEAKETQDDK